MKKTLKILAKTLIGIISFLLLYLGAAYTFSRITVNKDFEQSNAVTIYILSNGVHTDIVVPTRHPIKDWSQQILFSHNKSQDTTYPYLGMGWGDKGFYLETPEWKDLKASVAFKAMFGLSNTAIHATYHKSLTESDHCKKIGINEQQYRKLVQYIEQTFKKDSSGKVLPVITNAQYGNSDAFYDALGSYSMFSTCNSWANNALKVAGLKCCLWTAFDTGIFLKYP
jgi:uncharacterized protein (TIGR02117 family)